MTNAYGGADMKPIANGAPEGARLKCATTFKAFSQSDAWISKDTPLMNVICKRYIVWKMNARVTCTVRELQTYFKRAGLHKILMCC